MLHWTALVTVLAVLLYFSTALSVARARGKYGVAVPATTGNPDFERIFRVQMNTLEWMMIFLPLLWLFAYFVSDRGAAALGLVWIVGRILYMIGYAQAAQKRETGFFVQGITCGVLLIGALIGIVGNLMHG
jgi:glutathione S-transferase